MPMKVSVKDGKITRKGLERFLEVGIVDSRALNKLINMIFNVRKLLCHRHAAVPLFPEISFTQLRLVICDVKDFNQ